MCGGIGISSDAASAVGIRETAYERRWSRARQLAEQLRGYCGRASLWRLRQEGWLERYVQYLVRESPRWFGRKGELVYLKQEGALELLRQDLAHLAGVWWQDSKSWLRLSIHERDGGDEE